MDCVYGPSNLAANSIKRCQTSTTPRVFQAIHKQRRTLDRVTFILKYISPMYFGCFTKENRFTHRTLYPYHPFHHPT